MTAISDALEQIAVEYRPLPVIVDPQAAISADATLLYPAVGSNILSDRSFRYGDPAAALTAAAHRIAITTRYPRNAGTPLETFVVMAEHLPGEDIYEATANFQGPMAMHPVMALALGVPGNRLRLKTPPDSGGSFGAKHAVFPYIVLIALAARKRRAAGQMGRDKARTSDGGDLGDEPHHDVDRGGG